MDRRIALFAVSLSLVVWPPSGVPQASASGLESHGGSSLAACYDAGTPAWLIEQQRARSSWGEITSAQGGADGGGRYRLYENRWSRTATDGSNLSQGEPITLTWSIVPDDTDLGGFYVEDPSPSDLVTWLDDLYGDESAWLPLFQQAFDRWQEVTGITFLYEPNDDGAAIVAGSKPPGVLGVRGDIRIAAHFIDGDGGVLGYALYPETGDIVLDSYDASNEETANDSLKFRNLIGHEIGHVLGLEHVCPVDETKLMEPFATTEFFGPQHDDILAAHRSYGDRFEQSDDPGRAADLGALGAIELLNVSIDDAADVDYYSFSLEAGDDLSIRVTPVGFTYPEGPQGSECVAEQELDTLRLHDLSLTVLAGDGATEIASVDEGESGEAEALTGFVPSDESGSYFLAVQGSFADAAQLYRLQLGAGLRIFTDDFESGDTELWN